jgi:hypothetical protein
MELDALLAACPRVRRYCHPMRPPQCKLMPPNDCFGVKSRALASRAMSPSTGCGHWSARASVGQAVQLCLGEASITWRSLISTPVPIPSRTPQKTLLGRRGPPVQIRGFSLRGKHASRQPGGQPCAHSVAPYSGAPNAAPTHQRGSVRPDVSPKSLNSA